jgi:pimeloyl-ACP methyl ester carboxylesterase
MKAHLQVLSLVSKKKAAKKAFKIFSTPFRKSKAKPAPVFDLGELLSFHLNDLLITGYRWNHPAKRKVLIVHGFESSSKNFYNYIDLLIKKDFEVLAFDAPAHGRSEGKRIILPEYIETLTEIVRRYGPINHFIAHSFGGLSLVLYLENHMQDAASRIVLLAPATETTSVIDGFFHVFDLDEDVRKEFDDLILKRSGREAAHHSIRRAVGSIPGKILWIHDENDDVTPVEDALKVKNDGHPHLEFVITSGLGHRRIYKDEAICKQVVQFLADDPVKR